MRGAYSFIRRSLFVLLANGALAVAATPDPQVGSRLDFTSSDGHVYKHAIVRRIDPLGLTLETSDGFEKVPYSKLPPDLAAHFSFTEEEIARHQAKVHAEQRALAALQARETAAAQKAAQEKAAAEAAARQAQKSRATPIPAEPVIGARGATRLGTPQLGAKGTAK